jgi:hypothetical protein
MTSRLQNLNKNRTLRNSYVSVIFIIVVTELLMLSAAAEASSPQSTTTSRDSPVGSITDDTHSVTSDKASLTLEHVSSSVTSITVHWNSTAIDPQVQHVRIVARSLWTGVWLTSPLLNASAETYTLPDLAVDAPYRICIRPSTGRHVPVDQDETDDAQLCAEMSTIPFVRPDSVVGMFVAIGIFALLIFIACIIWRCAVWRASPRGGTDDSSTSPDKASNDQENAAVDEKSPLLCPPPGPAGNNDARAPGNDTTQQPDAEASSPAPRPESVYLYLAGKAFEG